MSAPIPSNFNFPTNQQVPSKSIEDINGKQTYLGNTFILPINGLTLEDTNEDPVALITNPVSSTKSLFLFTRTLTTNGEVVFRYYFNPTVVSDGTPTTPVNLRPASATTSSSLCYLSPTVSSNGTFFSTLGGEVFLEATSLTLFILDPGQSLYITAQASGADTVVHSENVWYEI
jgi:hypothetical protein